MKLFRRHLMKKNGEYLKDKLNELAIYVKNMNI
jgi:hypothetical protein